MLTPRRTGVNWAVFCSLPHFTHWEPKAPRNMMFISHQKPNNDVMSQCSVLLAVRILKKKIKLCSVTALLGTFLGTNKYQNLMSLRVAYHCYTRLLHEILKHLTVLMHWIDIQQWQLTRRGGENRIQLRNEHLQCNRIE